MTKRNANHKKVRLQNDILVFGINIYCRHVMPVCGYTGGKDLVRVLILLVYK